MNIVVSKMIWRVAEELLSLHGRILEALVSPIIYPLALVYRGVESSRVVKKLGYGLVGAMHMGVIQMVLMVVAVAAGFVVVRVWMEEPVVLQDRLNFDFREANPVGVVRFESTITNNNMIPVGRNFHVCVLLLIPDSPYNRELGLFQVTAKLLSTKINGGKKEGVTLSSSSHACMLRFSSAPIRLARTLLMAMPLIFGLSSETQHLHLPRLLKHTHNQELNGGYEIRVTLSPRAGTFKLPQLYDAHIVVKSEPPWTRDLVRRWKWTLSVWTSIYIYLALLMMLLSTFRTAFFTPFLLLTFMLPSPTASSAGEVSVGHDSGPAGSPALSASEVIRRMRQRRKNRTTVTTASSSTVTTATGTKLFSDDEEVASSHHPADLL